MLAKARYTVPSTRQQTLQFNGVRYAKATQDGDLAESLNLSSREFPGLTQRLGRAVVGSYTAPTAIHGKDRLVVVDGTNLLVDGEVVGQVTAGEKQIATVNSKTVVFPDKVYYDGDKGEFGQMALTLNLDSATFTDSTLEVKADPLEGKTLADLFTVNQAIEISGCSIEANNQTAIIRGTEGNKLTFYDGTFTAGSSKVTLERKVPDLLYICENDNRLFGVDEKTIWVSALGDPLTFYNYDGLSTDSFAVAVGTEGKFTGVCAYSSNVLFWKENTLHKLLGSEPSEYRIYTYTVPGVQEGSHKSLETVNEVLYYKGPTGVYAYTGGAPVLAGDNFGTRRFDTACAGTDGKDYYLSMRDSESGEWSLFVYDTQQGVWMREDDTHALDFARVDNRLHFLSGEGKLCRVGEAEIEGDMPWMALLAPFDWTVPEHKQYIRLYIQAELEAGAWIKVEIREDQGRWRQVFLNHTERRKNFALPIAPGRCDTLQVRLSGKGGCLIRQVTREYVVGGRR